MAMAWPEARDPIDAVCAVADGVGGHAAGDFASAIAVARLTAELRRAPNRREVNPTDRQSSYDLEGLLTATLLRANQEILEFGRQDPAAAGLGTTATVAVLSGEELLVANVGDSRAYLIGHEESQVEQITRDHSWVAQKVAEGFIGAGEARFHPNRNVLTQALGFLRGAGIDIVRRRLPIGQTLLVCTDGLHDTLDSHEIFGGVSRAGSLVTAADNLTRAAQAKGGQDDITVVLMRTEHRLSRPRSASLSSVGLAEDTPWP
ncbi:MAG: serine/threonine-protein phosphatase [Chloroflexi bacterium]|nr:serine/threonine-protein phosphatase [Chloroflexota bacterium]